MNQVATVQRPTKLETFRMEVLPPERKGDLFASLPAHVRPEVFERNLVNALMANPDLMEFDARLVFREVSKAAALGLYLDPQLGEAYLIVAWNGKTKRKEPQLRIGYRGLVKLGRQSGEFTILYAHEVHAGDTFKCVLGTSKSLVHEPDVFGERGDIVGYYSVVKYHDGDFDFEPLSVEQARGIRDRSDGWKAFADGKIKSTPWSTDEVEMSKKTAIRKLAKRLPQSPELAQALRIEDEAEHSGMRGVSGEARLALTPPPAPKVPPAPSEVIHVPESRQGRMPLPKEDEAPPHDPETGEIHDDEAGIPEHMRSEHDEAAQAEGDDTSESSEHASEAPAAEEGGSVSEAWAKKLVQVFSTAKTKRAVETFWTTLVEPKKAGMFPGDVAEVEKAYHAAMGRVGG